MLDREITVNARKFDFSIHRSWKARLVSVDESLLTLLGKFDTEVEHPDLGKISEGTISYEYYWLDRWFNVFRFHEPEGEFRNFYCNVNQPPVLIDDQLDYVDLDIDVLVSKDLTYRILDRDEFEANAALYGYPSETVGRAYDSLRELVSMIEARYFPFNNLDWKP